MTNSIRPVVVASKLGISEAQDAIDSGTPDYQGSNGQLWNKTDRSRDNEGWLEAEREEG